VSRSKKWNANPKSKYDMEEVFTSIQIGTSERMPDDVIRTVLKNMAKAVDEETERKVANINKTFQPQLKKKEVILK
jgi:hypothetical protein